MKIVELLNLIQRRVNFWLSQTTEKFLTYFVNSNREQGFIDMINAGKGLKHTSTKKSSLPSSLDVSDL
jgi:hypothetical protein